MPLPRRRFLQSVAGVTALPLVSQITRAQTFPTRRITLLVHVPAGGGPDIMARIVAQSLAGRLGQPVIIEIGPAAAAILRSRRPRARSRTGTPCSVSDRCTR